MRPPRRMAGPRTAAGTSGIPDGGGVAHGPGRRPLVWGGVMHALPRRRGADGLRGEVNPLQAVCGGTRRQAGTNGCRVRAMRRIPPSYGQARSCRVFPRRNGGTRTRGLAAPSRARCQLRYIPKPSPSSPGAEAPMGQKEDGGVARRLGLEPGSTVLETAVLAIAPPTQREASMTPRACRPVLRTAGVADASREPRAGFEPATCRLRGGCATTGPSGP